jgi:hypothetical protein
VSVSFAKTPQNKKVTTLQRFFLATHKAALYTLVIGCRNVIAPGKPESRGLKQMLL